MKTIKLGGLSIQCQNEIEEVFFRSRDAFVNKYCKEKGWDRQSLTIEQILEIRSQEGWK